MIKLTMYLLFEQARQVTIPHASSFLSIFPSLPDPDGIAPRGGLIKRSR
jgi:hypothetical protein